MPKLLQAPRKSSIRSLGSFYQMTITPVIAIAAVPLNCLINNRMGC
jgi:hypothetical protein